MKRQVNDEKHQQLVRVFYQKQQKLKAIQKKFEVLKSEFEEEMEALFGHNSKSIEFSSNLNDDIFSVKKVQKTSIEWDAEKLERKLLKSVAKKVIKKKYRITDMNGLIAYLKSCGVDPNVFKKYIAVEKTVDQKEVDRLGELGQISVKNISGCYVVKCHKPYFVVSAKKGNGDEE